MTADVIQFRKRRPTERQLQDEARREMLHDEKAAAIFLYGDDADALPTPPAADPA